jgi:hypothetical protein
MLNQAYPLIKQSAVFEVVAVWKTAAQPAGEFDSQMTNDVNPPQKCFFFQNTGVQGAKWLQT